MLLRNSPIPQAVSGSGKFIRSSKGFVPAWIRSIEAGQLSSKIERALAELSDCVVCPRNCHVDRLADRIGVCKSGRLARVSAHFPHFGEEDVLRGWHGSGTIFFAWCNLRCVFCQNYETSQDGQGGIVSPQRIAQMMYELQQEGCHNINFVTPEHVVPQILEALPFAYEVGVRLPIVYNTSSYDSLTSIELMDGIVDIYMPDFKLWNKEPCRKYLLAPDYSEVARKVTKLMNQQVGELVVNEDGLALRGVIVRHLVMPGMLDETREIMKFIANELSPDTFVNVMDQYYPAYRAKTDAKYAEINRRIHPEEMETAYEAGRSVGLWRFDTRWRWLR
jgi:putative pyruvate formate lyase activating enzyme